LNFPTDDPEQAISFYQEIFGWQLVKWEGPMEYWLVKTGTGTGIDGGMMRRTPGASISNTIEVSDLDSIVKQVEAKGGKIALPRMAVPGVGCSPTVSTWMETPSG
jgi:predicted enzyme related to lactoylglutathione lyase